MAKIDIIKIDLDKNKYSIKAPHGMKPIGITIHETDNNASARNEIAYMQRNNNKVSYHFAVDEKEIIQGLPLDRNGWHASDGNGTGNRKTIAIEICRNYDRNNGGIPKEYYKARENAEKLVGYLLHKYGWTDKDIYTHHHWIGKNCPRRIREQGYLDTFKKNAMNWKNKFAGDSETPVETPKKDLDTIVSEVIRGDWGNGDARKRNLEKAGYNYVEVQKAVNDRLSGKKPTQSKPKPKPQPSKPKYKAVTAAVVNDVIMGKYGNGAARKTNLEKAGYNYNEVQSAVNKQLGAKAKPKAKPSNKTLKRGSKVKTTATRDIFGTRLDKSVIHPSRTFTVEQVGRNGNMNHILLKEVMTWVHKDTVKVV